MSFGQLACIAAALQISWAATVSEGNGDCAALPREKSAGEHVMLQHSTQQSSAPARVMLDILSSHDEKHFPTGQVMLQHAEHAAPAPASVNLKTLSIHDATHYPESLQDRPSALLHTEDPAYSQLSRQWAYKFESRFDANSTKRSLAADFNTPALLASVLNISNISDPKQQLVPNRSFVTELADRAKPNSSLAPRTQDRARQNSSLAPRTQDLARQNSSLAPPQGQEARDGEGPGQPPLEYTFKWVGYGQCVYDVSPDCGLCINAEGHECAQRGVRDCFSNIGWTTCNTGIIGGCGGLTACQDFCRETEDCGAVDYFKGHCWMFKKVIDDKGSVRPYLAGNHMVQWYHCWAKTVAAPEPEVTTTTTTTTTGWAGAWFIGEAGTSCNEVCADAGGCHEMELYELDTELEVQEVANRLETPCDAYKQNGTPKPISPAYRYEELTGTTETYEGRMCYWRPSYENPMNRNCDAKDKDFIRICPCNDASYADA